MQNLNIFQSVLAQPSCILFCWSGLLELWLRLTSLKSFLPTLGAWSKINAEKFPLSLRTHRWFIRESEIPSWRWCLHPPLCKGCLSDRRSQVEGRKPAPSSEGGFIPQAQLTIYQKLPPEEMSAEDDVSSAGAALGEAGLAYQEVWLLRLHTLIPQLVWLPACHTFRAIIPGMLPRSCRWRLPR